MRLAAQRPEPAGADPQQTAGSREGHERGNGHRERDEASSEHAKVLKAARTHDRVDGIDEHEVGGPDEQPYEKEEGLRREALLGHGGHPSARGKRLTIPTA